MKNVFDSIPVPRLGRNFFDLSHTHRFDCDAGQIIPCFYQFFMPGDHFKLGNNIVVRPQPMVRPILTEVKVYTYYFAVSNRIMFGEMVEDSDGVSRWEIKDRAFERFISGGETGQDDTIQEPRWNVDSSMDVVNDNWNGIPAGQSGSNLNDINVSVKANGKYSLWDYFGMPVGVDFAPEESVEGNGYSVPKDYLRRAYNLIYNWYFRDKNFMDEIDVANSNKVMNCCWKKDYFTSALPWTQRGVAPTLPFTGHFVANYTHHIPEPTENKIDLGHKFSITGDSVVSGSLNLSTGASSGTRLYLKSGNTLSNYSSLDNHQISADDMNTAFRVEGDGVTINDLRFAARLQQWMERNAITGIDYRQFILAHFGVAPADERLQKPLFLGSSINPLWISEVVQTSESGTTAQGNLSGHGLTAGSNFVCRYSAKEFGWIIGVMVIKPTASYQQGVPRYLLYQNRYEYPFPEFMHLGEREIYKEELYAQDVNVDPDTHEPLIFGYTGMYNELRYNSDYVSGGLRDTFNYWHWGRIFGDAPSLNEDFLKMRPDKRIFLVQNEPSFVVNIGNVCHSWRPMPKYPVPTLL